MNTLRVYIYGIYQTVKQSFRILRAARHPDRPGNLAILREAPKTWCASFLKSGRVKVVIEGLENVPPNQPAVLVANHESWYDTFAMMGLLPFDMRWIGKKELVKIPFFGPAWVASGNIPIDRGDRRAAIESLQKAGEALRKDSALVIMFPEGTRSSDGNLLPFKKGAFVLALQMGVPVIPLGISGSRAVMPKGSGRVKPGTITLRIGTPISVEGRTERDRNELLEEAREAIELLRAPDQITEKTEERD